MNRLVMANHSTPVISIDPYNPDRAILQRAAEVIRRGGLVAFPTETVYGLGANALDAHAVRRIFEAKGRPVINPVIAHVSDRETLNRLVADWPHLAETLADRFWPGPLTMVLPKGDAVPNEVTAGGTTIAVRMPAHLVAIGLIREAGVPLAAPSANRSSQLSPTRAEHVLAGMDGRIDLILDGGPTVAGIESTVLDLTTSPPTVLRPGPITVEDLQRVIGSVEVRSSQSIHGPLPSPGLLPRHYSPKTPVELFESRASLDERLASEPTGERLGRLLIGTAEADVTDQLLLPADPRLYSARLYDALHTLDARGLAGILIELPPDIPEWLAVRDRLSRAAGG
jgi:L-threonylcarbamoyladenylate synthase